MASKSEAQPAGAVPVGPDEVDAHRTSSTVGAAFNIFCAVVGTGLLQVSYGAAKTGWIGVGLLVVMGGISCYTAILLTRCLDLIQQINSQRSDMESSTKSKCAAMPAQSYGDIGQAVLGASGKRLVGIMNYVTMVMVGVVYNLLAGLNLAAVAPESWEWLTPVTAIILASCVLWLHVFLKTLGEVAIVSTFNTMVTLLLVVVVVIESLRHPPQEPAQKVFVVPDLMSLGSGFASFVMAFGVHNVLPCIYSTMRTPSAVEPMLRLTFAAILVVTLPVMCVGYGVYGSEVRSPIYMTPALASSSLVTVMVLFITVHLFGAYPLLMNPPEVALERALGTESKRCPLLWRVSLRTGFVLTTCSIAIAMRSEFPPLLELVASFSLCLLMFILPCVFYARLSQLSGQPLTSAELAWCAVIITVSLVGAVFGTSGAIKDVLSSFGM